MFSPANINSTNLPDKTLCLTYDDGPGDYSAEIGRFLKERGVRATFFVVGKFAAEHPEILEELHANGHIIGNHTYEHPDLPFYGSLDGDMCDQVSRAHAVIHKYNKGELSYFRAPYGKWSPEVAKALNANIRSSFRQVGPVHWDIDGIDCYYWSLGKSVEEAADTYVKSVQAQGRGIVVMHDNISDMDTVKAKNRTLELTQLLIPRLQALGYRFVGLDEIDDPQLTSAAADSFALKGQNGKFLRAAPGGGDNALSWSGDRHDDDAHQFVMERRPGGKIVLRTATGGRYLEVNAEKDATVRLNDDCTEFALFDDIPVRGSQMMLRSHNGNYLAGATGQGGLLQANAQYMRQAWCISYVPRGGAYVRPVTLAQRIARMKRRFLFVKSKLMQG